MVLSQPNYPIGVPKHPANANVKGSTTRLAVIVLKDEEQEKALFRFDVITAKHIFYTW